MQRPGRFMGTLVVLAAAFSGALVRGHEQPAPSADRLAAVERLVGRWTGTSEGQPGNGRVERTSE